MFCWPLSEFYKVRDEMTRGAPTASTTGDMPSTKMEDLHHRLQRVGDELYRQLQEYGKSEEDAYSAISRAIAAEDLLKREKTLREEAHTSYKVELEKLKEELRIVSHEKLFLENILKETRDQLQGGQKFRAELQKELEKLSAEKLCFENLAKDTIDQLEEEKKLGAERQDELGSLSHEKRHFENLATETMNQLEKERELRAEAQEKMNKLSDEKQLLENEINKFNILLNEILVKQKEANVSLREKREKRIHMQKSSHNRWMLNFTMFSHSELVNATEHFDPILRIADGTLGPVYKADIQSTLVIIKMISNETTSIGVIETTNAGLKHPNLLSPIGGCKEPKALIYEYLLNGSLKDQLESKEAAEALTWQIRTFIVAEICWTLLFLHSTGEAHGNLKLTRILLDSNFSVKITSFSRKPGSYDVSADQRADIHSLATIILQLLTGKEHCAKDLAMMFKKVEEAVQTKRMNSISDKRAGKWPVSVSLLLATLALECYEGASVCECPDLKSHIQSILSFVEADPSASSANGPQEGRLGREEPPPYFVCPISQDVMTDPQVAADGFTYEGKVLRKWFDGGHKTSPMTNQALNHLNLTPNHALRSAIQEWLQHHISA